MIKSLFYNKKIAASLSVTSNLCLIIIKLITGFVSGSVSIISEAIHSASDFLASVITLFAVHKAEKPAEGTGKQSQAERKTFFRAGGLPQVQERKTYSQAA